MESWTRQNKINLESPSVYSGGPVPCVSSESPFSCSHFNLGQVSMINPLISLLVTVCPVTGPAIFSVVIAQVSKRSQLQTWRLVLADPTVVQKNC
jgi:cytochrome b subunit of formate dehydrogenase